MRILSVNNSSDLYGASRCLERIFSRFVQEGHEVFIVLPDHGPLAALLQSKGVHVLFHPRLAIVERHKMRSIKGICSFLLCWPVSVFWLAMSILRLQIDLVHTNTAVMPTPALAALITGRPHIWHVREFFAEFGLLWNVYQIYICLLSISVIAISLAVRSQFAKRFEWKVRVVYDGLPHEFTEQKSSGAKDLLRERFDIRETILIGVVGRIKWVRKGQEILVEAFAQLKDHYPNTRLLIIGSAAKGNEEHLRQLVEFTKTTGTASRVTFTGDMEAGAPLYAAMDITVVPSVTPEPFGCVVMESMAAGTVVVGSNSGGIAEQIVNGESGMLFPPGDADQLAQCLDQLLANEHLRIRLARGGQERFRSHFGLDRTFEATLKVFQQASAPLETPSREA